MGLAQNPWEPVQTVSNAQTPRQRVDLHVKNGEVGDSGPGENDDGAVSVKALLSEVPLCEWNGPSLPPKSS